jgi:hypothetical protein
MKYIVQLKERGRWVRTCWTDPNGENPLPVGKVLADEAIKYAQRCYKRNEYRIVEAK